MSPFVKPFDEEKYKTLMDGLECSEVLWSYVKKSSDILRLDSFFFAKEFLNDENLIMKHNPKTIAELGAKLRSFGAYSLNNDVEYLESGIPFIRGVNMKSGLVDFDDLVYISNTANQLLWKSEIKPNTILLSMSGTIGDVAIAMPNWDYPINSNQDIAKIYFNGDFNSYYIYAFLTSKYGQNYLKREARGSVQQHVFLSQMANFNIPLLSDEIQHHIENIVIRANDISDKSKFLYSDAEKILLTELGLTDYTPTNESVAVKTFANSFGATGRLDSEYYQPKYDELFSAICNFDNDKLGNIVTIKKSIEPGSKCYGDEGVPFVRVSNLSKYEISEPDIKIPFDTVKNINELYPKKDTILMSKDGSVGIAYKVSEDMNFVTSGAILHLTIKDTVKILPNYLTLVLNSLIVQMQAERDAGGSIIQHWKPSEIEQVVIPILDYDVQQQIAQKVQESFSLRKKSAELLELAKKAVEIAIEYGEDAATEFINKQEKVL